MARRKKRRSVAEANIGPFSDIAFLLIIFFILTTTLARLAGNRLDIPAAQESTKKSDADQPTITLSGERILWGASERAIPLKELRGRLYELDLPAKDPGRRVVVINCSPNVIYQRYYEVMMAITEAGGVLGIVADPGEKADEDSNQP